MTKRILQSVYIGDRRICMEKDFNLLRWKSKVKRNLCVELRKKSYHFYDEKIDTGTFGENFLHSCTQGSSFLFFRCKEKHIMNIQNPYSVYSLYVFSSTTQTNPNNRSFRISDAILFSPTLNEAWSPSPPPPSSNQYKIISQLSIDGLFRNRILLAAWSV